MRARAIFKDNLICYIIDVNGQRKNKTDKRINILKAKINQSAYQIGGQKDGNYVPKL